MHLARWGGLNKEPTMQNIAEHMEVIGADGVHVGTVDKVEGNRIKLMKKDSGEGVDKGHHLYRKGLAAGVEVIKSGCRQQARRCRHGGRTTLIITAGCCSVVSSYC